MTGSGVGKTNQQILRGAGRRAFFINLAFGKIDAR
jgi:hypothetical protein